MSDEAADHAGVERALQDAAPAEGLILTGWAIVAEWMTPEGTRALSRFHAPDAPVWQANGLWHEALYGDWPDET